MDSFEQMELMMSIIRMQQTQIDYLLEKDMYPELLKRDMYDLHNPDTWFKDSPDLIFSNQISNKYKDRDREFLGNIESHDAEFQLQVSQNGVVEWKCKAKRLKSNRYIYGKEYNLVCHLDKRITRDELDKIVMFFERLDLRGYGKLDDTDLRKISILLKSQLS